MQRLEVSGAVRPIYASLGLKGLMRIFQTRVLEKIATRILCLVALFFSSKLVPVMR
jgi:hypothetical protein